MNGILSRYRRLSQKYGLAGSFESGTACQSGQANASTTHWKL
jgi:hypothetical protein